MMFTFRVLSICHIIQLQDILDHEIVGVTEAAVGGRLGGGIPAEILCVEVSGMRHASVFR